MLVVDDEAEIRASLTRLLGLLGYEADSAASGEQALAMLKRTRYDVAVLDIRLPGIDGVETMHLAAELRPQMRTILLTGHATLDTAIAAVKSGAADYLRKPAGRQQIGAAIAAALEWRPQDLRAGQPGSERFMQAGPLTLDRDRRIVIIGPGPTGDARAASLTSSETALLSRLMLRPNVAASCRELAAALGYHLDEQAARIIIRPHIARIRKKTELDPGSPRLIQTVVDRGYVLRFPV